MDRLNNTVNQVDYNEEPIFYCKHCLSLTIKAIENVDYCDECGGTDIEKTDIYTWEKEYKEKYGVKYLNVKKNGRKNK